MGEELKLQNGPVEKEAVLARDNFSYRKFQKEQEKKKKKEAKRQRKLAKKNEQAKAESEQTSE